MAAPIIVHVFVLVITALVAAPDGSVSVQVNNGAFADAAHCEAKRIDMIAATPDIVGASLLVCHDEAVTIDPDKMDAAKKAAAVPEDAPPVFDKNSI